MRAMMYFVSFLILLSHRSIAQAEGEPLGPTADSVCLGEILITTPQPYDPAQVADAQHKADSARGAIEEGAEFEDIARKYSDGPSAAVGGALGRFKRGQLAKQIEDRVFAMKVGDVSDVIRTKQGFAILKVSECGLVIRVGGTSGAVEILGDTRGIDFAPYLQRLVKKVKSNWYSQVPQSEETKTGEVTIEFAVTTGGKLANMRLVAGSGNAVLDRAAWRGLELSSPFPRLPSGFTGADLALRFNFIYNPDKSKLD